MVPNMSNWHFISVISLGLSVLLFPFVPMTCGQVLNSTALSNEELAFCCFMFTKCSLFIDSNNSKKVRLSQLCGQRRKFGTSSGLSRIIKSTDAHPILKSSSLQHWFKNWEEQRKHKLTASTFAAAIGFFPGRRVQLWLEKIGAIEPFSGNLATCWSNIKEQEALDRYQLITGNPVSLPNFQVYGKTNDEDDDWLGASPDGLVDKFVYDLPSRGVLEIKCPYFDGDMSKAYPLKRIPLYYIPQAQGLMEILDRDWMDLYVWTAKGSSLFRLHRDRDYWDLLAAALSDFWFEHVQPAKKLYTKSVIEDPLFELRFFRPASRHEQFGSLACASKLVVDNSSLLMREIYGKLQYD